MIYKKMLLPIILLMFFIFFADKLADKFYWYNSIWYFDIIMHFLGGVWVGLFFIYVFSRRSLDNLIFKVVLSVLLIGIFWEIFEFYVNNVVGRTPFNVVDTLFDIIFDFFGGLLSVLYFLKKIMKASENRVQ